MAAEEDIFRLLHKCSLNREEEDEVEITEEQKGEFVDHFKMIILGRLASIQSFNRGGLKDAMLRTWRVTKEEVKFLKISMHLYQIRFESIQVMSNALNFGPWLFEDYLFLTVPWKAEIHIPFLRIHKCMYKRVRMEIDVDKPLFWEGRLKVEKGVTGYMRVDAPGKKKKKARDTFSVTSRKSV
ncbi:hypothetical protein Sjap_017791 [Stephania japonica]|uniref:DUF4283 domain-containing protein n=1 Tax=Stephania japonica TaxID=461633 RepID=A0AAP0I6U0_9MAGN